MAEIFPFQAYRYNPAKVDLARAVTQPYDKITAAMQERYYNLGPQNLVAVEKGRTLPGDTPSNNVYTRAAANLKDWIARGVLVRDPAPAIYVHFQEYHVPHTQQRKVRQGFIALSRIEDYAAGVVFRHEQTLAGPKADRLELLRHTRAHTGQLLMVYSDPSRRVDALLEEASQQPPQVEVRDEYDVLHRLWPVSDARLVASFEREMADKKLVIADGHHRYETALAYRDECRAAGGSTGRDAPHEKVMMTFFNTCSEGLTILPTHRVVSNLRGFQWTAFRGKMAAYFDIGFHPFDKAEERPGAFDLLRSHFEEEWREGRNIGVYGGQNSWSDERAFFLFTLKPEVDLAALLPDISPLQRELDVVLLHRLILEKGLGIKAEAVVKEKNITYEREMEAAIAAVDKGHAQLCFLLNPVRVEQVARIALAGEVMPQKSTDFYPKLLSGLTIYRLDG